MAALSLTHQKILSDGRIAPDGILDDDSEKLETASSDLSFEGGIQVPTSPNKASPSADLSTDDEAMGETISETCENFGPVIPGGSRLPVFQSVCYHSSKLVVTPACKQEDSITKIEETDQGLLKTLKLDEQHESWS